MEALLTKLSFVITIALELLVIYLLVRRRLERRFLWFFAYIVYEVIESVLRFASFGGHSYFKIFWFTEIGEILLATVAVAESFLKVFWMYARLRWFSWTVWSCVAVALLYSILKAWFFPPVQAPFLTSLVLGLEVAVDYSIGIVGILYFVLILFFKIKEHRWESGIISGFTTIAVVSVLGALTRSVFGKKFTLLNQWFGPVAYLLAEIEWIFTLSHAEQRVPVPPQNFTIKDVTILDQYIRILGRLLGRKS